MPCRQQASMAAKQQELDAVRADLEQHKDRLRKGRYHLISEQVQEAKLELHKHMVAQWDARLQAAKAECAAEEASTRERWQEAVLQLVSTAVGEDVMDELQPQLACLAKSQRRTAELTLEPQGGP